MLVGRRWTRWVLGAVLLSISTAAPARAEATPDLGIDFGELASGQASTAPRLSGTAATGLTSRVVTSGGGAAITTGSAKTGDGRALRLPSHQPLASNPPLAVLGIRPNTASDPLDIGYRDFTISADFRLFRDLGGDPSDGDNVFQRGLWNDPAQWKFSVDERRARCHVSIGERRVATPSVYIPDDGWYRGVCRRETVGAQQQRLVMVVQHWNGSQFVTIGIRQSRMNAWGRLTFSPTTPISVGGKLTSATTLHVSPDQLNGVVDRIRLWIQ